MIMAEDLQCLKKIALMGGCKEPIWASSQMLGGELKISPQTASRRLISLEKLGLINRTIRADGQYIAITKEGEKELKREYTEYCKVFGNNKGHFVLEGEVIDGLGEGRYYVSIPEYHRQFVEKLGFEPYPGTFNVKLNPASIHIRKKLDALYWIDINGFAADERTFGIARSLPCTVGGHPCAIIVPSRTHYPEDVIEIISPVQLRTTLNVKSGDRVKVEVHYG
jgi:riboflavin kinase